MPWRLSLLALLLAVLAACRSEPTTTIATASALPAPSTALAPAASAPPPPAGRCSPGEGAEIWTFPRDPQPGTRLVVVALADQALDAKLVVRRKDEVLAESAERSGATPFHWLVEVATAEPGVHDIRLETAAASICKTVTVARATAPRPSAAWSAVWPIERSWTRQTESLYSAWIERLFDAPLGEQPMWPDLSKLLRDPSRNFLHDHLGLAEDHPDTAPLIEPDCADLPYTLRAYFAFKLGLPFGFSRCTRGSSASPPSCQKWLSSQTANDGSDSPVRRLGNFLRVRLANAVHSGSVRVKGDDDRGDFYPVRLDRRSLSPGTVYADPYGHILVVVKRLPQTDGAGGLLLAVDGQPDNTISRRRFWRGNFLFASDPVFGGPGFKRFRPVVVEAGQARPLSSAEIAAHPDWADYSLEQYDFEANGFHDAVEAVLSPEPRDPELAFLAIVDAFDEQVRRRLVSVDNAMAWRKTHPGVIEMPEGAEIFETSGAWEDFATPSRDMRLLIALDVVREMPQRVSNRPERWAMPRGVRPHDLAKRLTERLVAEASKRRFSYRRSDGLTFELSLADVLARAEALEISYNPNDCPELRWAAPEGSEERSTCRGRAPAGQRAQMERYRPWFRDRRRPPRP